MNKNINIEWQEKVLINLSFFVNTCLKKNRNTNKRVL